MGRVVGFWAKRRLGPSDSQIRFYPAGFCKIGLHKQAHLFFRSKNKNQKLGIRSHNKQPKDCDIVAEVSNCASRGLDVIFSVLRVHLRAVIIEDIFFIFMKFISKCGGVLSRFVIFNNPGKS